ncbi:MAG: hypothetical protein IT427_19715 [Pirellulales bacterium]|nr:hypothetical protein [Pirellulales bacterium]
MNLELVKNFVSLASKSRESVRGQEQLAQKRLQPPIFLLVPVLHPCLMDHDAVQETTLSFLEHGYFATDQPQPIEK